MKHYIKPDNSIWAFELDGSQDHLITQNMMPIEGEALELVRNPPLTSAQIVSNRVQEIRVRLSAIDADSIRALRSIARGRTNIADTNKLETLDTEAENLRTELGNLQII